MAIGSMPTEELGRDGVYNATGERERESEYELVHSLDCLFAVWLLCALLHLVPVRYSFFTIGSLLGLDPRLSRFK